MLARLLIKAVTDMSWQADMVIPVPLSKNRWKERGYNQSALLALPVALYFGWKYAPKSLARVRETKSQVGLSVPDRWANVVDAFRANREMVARKRVLLIDDVCTTGATMKASAQALSEAGADHIICLTLAKSVYAKRDAEAELKTIP